MLGNEDESWSLESATQAIDDYLNGLEVVEGQVNRAMVALALNEEDRRLVEQWCLRVIVEGEDPRLRGLAALCAGGHVARRFGVVSPDVVAAVIAMSKEPANLGSGQVLDALDDIRHCAPASMTA